MTGFEYTARGRPALRRQVDEGLRCIAAHPRALRRAQRRSPFDEAECGHHYARAMASWGAVIALTGFTYNAQTGTMRFAPRLPNTHTIFWSTGNAYGTFNTTTRTLTTRRGQTHLTALYLHDEQIPLQSPDEPADAS